MKRALLTLLVALSLLVPWPVVLLAAVAHVQTIETNDTAGSSSTLVSSSITLTAGNLLLAGIVETGPAVSTVQLDGTTSFTLAAAGTDDGGAEAAIYYLANIAGGSHTVTVTFASASTYDSLWLTEVSGAATTSPLDGTCAVNKGNSTMTSSGTYTSVATSFIYGVVVSTTGSNPVTPGSGWTEPATGESGVNIGQVEYKANPGSTTHDNNPTVNSSSFYSSIACGFKVASAAAARPCLLSLLGVGAC